jgi:hypothetical protein
MTQEKANPMRMTRAKEVMPNSPANPLPTSIWGPNFRCRTVPEIVAKPLISRKFPMSRERFLA